MKKLEEVKDIFILDRGPTYETSIALPGQSAVSSKSSQNIIIEGRILPKSEPYCQRSFHIMLTLQSQYPFHPPALHILDPIYHPNIDIRGTLCIRLTNEYDSYKLTTTISSIIKNAEEIISNFDEELVINIQAYQEYQNDRNEFNRKTRDFILRYGHPRT
jgi:ubiquitin-protein ligase